MNSPAKGKTRRQPSGAKTIGLKRILVPVDFSSASYEALNSAAALAGQFGASITLLHVIEPPPYPMFGYAAIPMREAKLKSVTKDRLEELRNRRPLTPKLVKKTVVRVGSAYREIVDEAKGSIADLIVISTHGHTGLAHLLLGSVAERVVRHAPCPVFVVRKHHA